MAIEPFRQRIGIASPGSLISGNAPQISDPGPAIRAAAQSIREAVQPGLERKAVEAGKKAAGEAVIQRDAQGNPIKIERPEGGGNLFNAAFDKVAETRYINQVNYDFQNYLNTEINDRRVGKDGKQFDPDQFDAAVQGRIEGMLQSIDPQLRPVIEETVYREALERTRSFRDEWGRTQRAQAIAGSKDQLEIYLNGLSNFDKEGITWNEAWFKYGAPADKLINSMREAQQVGPEEFEALLMRVDNLVESGEGYVIGMEVATKAAPIITRLNEGDLDAAENYLNGINSGEITGTQIQVTGSGMSTFDAMIKQESQGQQFRDGKPLTSSAGAVGVAQVMEATGPEAARLAGVAWDRNKWLNDRDYNLKIGRAYFDMLVKKYDGDEIKAAAAYNGGMRRVNAAIRDEGANWERSAALPSETKQYIEIVRRNMGAGQTSKITQDPEAQKLTFETLSKLDPSAKRALQGLITRRRQDISEEQAIARARAAEEERQRLEDERNQAIINSITGSLANGIGGNWNAQQKGAFESSFTKVVDLSKLNDPNQQANALRFIQTNQYVPESLVNYMTNTVRSDNWRSAVQLFRNIKSANVGGATVGDLLVEGVDARSRALLSAADELIAAGQPSVVVDSRIEQLRSNNGFTVDEARGEYNRVVGGGQGGSYINARNKKIAEIYGIKETAIPAALTRRIDESFAANLDVQNRNPEAALDKAFQQNKSVYTKSGVFFDGLGPSVLTRSFTNQQLANFFNTITRSGRKLVPEVKGADGVTRKHSIGAGGTIKLVPLDNTTGNIGLYEVRLFDPLSKSNMIDNFRIDLGAELNKWASTQRKPAVVSKPAAGQDPVAAARAKRSETQRFLETVAPPDQSRSLRGPKM
jgi:soluble lytic murein transglycosylase-like protein